MREPDSLRFRFHHSVGGFLLDAAFDAPAQGITAIFGPSGCGKTSVLRCIAGLQRAAGGICDVAGDIWQDQTKFVPTHK